MERIELLMIPRTLLTATRPREASVSIRPSPSALMLTQRVQSTYIVECRVSIVRIHIMSWEGIRSLMNVPFV